MPVNKSVMRQIDYNKISKKANFFFEDINRNYITLRDEKNTPVHFNLDYEFSFFSAKDNSYWANEDLDFRSPEGKILRLVIKYSPRYFTLTQSSTYTNPILSYTNSKGKTSSLYLEPNLENLQKDFKSIQDTKFIKISELK